MHQLQIEFECAESLRSLFAVRVPAVSGAIVELDTRLTGLRRSRYLRTLARGEDAEVVECWDGAQLVGYSLMPDLKRAYWVAIVCTLATNFHIDSEYLSTSSSIYFEASMACQASEYLIDLDLLYTRTLLI